jgi:hypothetical protein
MTEPESSTLVTLSCDASLAHVPRLQAAMRAVDHLIGRLNDAAVESDSTEVALWPCT